MSDPWLSIVGLGEDGPAGLTDASRAALAEAEIVFGGQRHLSLMTLGPRGQAWPVPFDLAPLLALRGRPVAMLVSGDPFWHGAGGSVVRHLTPGEWRAFPAAGVFSRAAACLGWRLEEVVCLGLHAAPFERLLPIMARGARVLCTVRDGQAPAALAAWLTQRDMGATQIHVLEALGGPRERHRTCAAAAFSLTDVAAPVSLALDAAALARGAGLPRGTGLPDRWFAHDGQITKQPMRALTLSALAPRPGALLWDVGAGSGSVSVEWALAGGQAQAIEARADRIANIRANIAAFGLGDRVSALLGEAPHALTALPEPDAVFVGGGGSEAVLDTALGSLAPGGRLVANSVTLETEALLIRYHDSHGGHLQQVSFAEATRLGSFRGWAPARPQVQWVYEKSA